MTEKQLRKKAADCITAWGGTKQGSKKHKEIIDTYNAQKSLPSGYKMTYKDAWCAASVSVVSLTLGMNAEEFPTECSCRRMIERFKKLNLWVEDDRYKPNIGDLVMYYWNDNKNTYMVEDCTKDPDHVGLVTSVSGNTFTVSEGNMTSAHVVGSRIMEVNGRYIRGFCAPNYAVAAKRLSAAQKATQAATGGSARAFATVSVKMPILKLGAKGAPVEALQCLLLLHGYSCGDGGMDGSFGPDTNVALRKFQKERSLAVDGSCGNATWTELIFG